MADLKALRDEFVAEFEAGNDPALADWLSRVGESERQDLERLIDGYLMTAPRRAWDPVGFETSIAKRAVDRAVESLDGVSGSWPEVLPRLRKQRQMLRSDLVRRLADALGVGTTEPQLSKVGAYYHQMEHGLLPAGGVTDTVLEALADLVGSSTDALRRAGDLVWVPPSGPTTSFARTAMPDAEFVVADMASGEPAVFADAAGPPPERDRIDELFTGGTE